MGIIEAKEQDFRNIVEEISKDLDLEHIPEVIFYDGYIPNQSSNVQACIDTYKHIIHVSKRHLMTMDARDIRNTVIHELSHYKVKNHSSEFIKEYTEIHTGTWKPLTGHGILHIDGGRRSNKNNLIKIKWTPIQIEEFKKFHKIVIGRMQRGLKNPFDGKPEGFSEWLKETWSERRKITRTNNSRFSLIKVCSNCGRKYGGTKCPYCGKI